jgi:ATP-dependent helicase/nuclease subunit B
MGANYSIEIDAWLRDGGPVVTASNRAARAVTSRFHRARRAQGLTAWPTPQVLDWQQFVRSAWETQTADSHPLLNPRQELSLWERIIADSGHSAALLEKPRQRLAAMAMEAHQVLCTHAPRFLNPATRTGWQQDAAAFGKWLSALDEYSHANKLLSLSRLPLELNALLQAHSTRRSTLLLAGFDRFLPIQRAVFDSWGKWREATVADQTPDPAFYAASDAQSELAACAEWCKIQIAANPKVRLLVVTQDATGRRGEIERAFLRHCGPASSSFEFSLGIPLLHTSLARSAILLLSWLAGALDEAEVDWLFSTDHSTTTATETAALQASMRALRRRGLQRTHWTLKALMLQPTSAALPRAWVQRMTDAQRRHAAVTPRAQSPLEWAALVPHLLEAAGWSGIRPSSSADFQIVRRWQQAVETCASLGFDGRRIRWSEFLSELERELNETLFAPESEEAPILIAGPAESAGLDADAIWFLTADEDAWPPRGSMHPLLPIEVQREAAMPHASPQLDWDLAQATTLRLLSSAPEIHFSYAQLKDGVETRPSRLVTQLAGQPLADPHKLATKPPRKSVAIPFADASRIPRRTAEDDSLQNPTVLGGSNVLTSQSQCPFKAFATARLGAQDWEPAEAGLSAAIRGQLLHAVMHAIWAGPPDGIRTPDELKALPHRRAFVATHVQHVLTNEIPPGIREQMPPRYLELEEMRLTRLVLEWLEFELTRLPFAVAATEVDASPTIAGLTLKLRLDRVDRLNDGTLLVVDYKTGNVSPSSWDLPRPDDVQLPLYAGFALSGSDLGGLVFARVRLGDLCLVGRVGNATSTLFSSLNGGSALVKDPLTAEQLIDWKANIEQLARDFLAGRAEVDPRDYPVTCKRCGLQTLCRVQESRFATSDDSDETEGANE